MKPVHSQLLDSFLMVASVATQGMYSRQNTIRHTAFSGPKPIAVRASVNASEPCAAPSSTAQLETTTSLAEMPAISATTICQKPSPITANAGERNLPMYPAKPYSICSPST